MALRGHLCIGTITWRINMLAEAIKEFKEHKRVSKRCIVGDWSLALSEEDQIQLKDAILDNEISTRQLHKILRSAGATFSLEAIRKHRNEECPCQS